MSILTVKQVAELLQVTPHWVYMNKHLLGCFQLRKGGAIRFFENDIVKMGNKHAIQAEKRHLSSHKNDQRPKEDKGFPDEEGGRGMGGRPRQHSLKDRDKYCLFTD